MYKSLKGRERSRCATRWTHFALLSITLTACGSGGEQHPRRIDISVLSGRADMVSGGSTLIGLVLPPTVPASAVKLKVNGVDTGVGLQMAAGTSQVRALVSGLKVGRNELVATIDDEETSGRTVVENYPRSGPIFSGLHLAPFECRTAESGLGAPLDGDCTVATRFEWFYFTADGVRRPLADPLGPRPADVGTTTTLDGNTVPFIVRVESGTINRSIYRIAVLDDPRAPDQWNPNGWNGRIVFRFGESTGAQYNQGTNSVNDVFKVSATDVQSVTALQRGFAYVVSSLNINKVNVNDVLAAETAMMLREHVAKTYGVPRWMVGMGGSGGAIQQMLIAQNYPGILDGVMPDAAFPDVLGTALAVTDCRLLNRYFQRNASDDATRRAFEGHLKGTCSNWDAGNGDVIVATSGSVTPACGLNDSSRLYSPTTNPSGTRCSVYDMNANSLGREQSGGFVRRPLDNVGVQYGLASLRSGQITATQFIDLNETIGGFDRDGNLVGQRTAADPEASARTYELGRIGSGGGGLATVPIFHMRAYAEPSGDVHTIYNDIKIREQLVRANGQADNQVIWLLPHPGLAQLLGLGTAQQQVLAQLLRDTFTTRLDLMTSWLDALSADPAQLTPTKVARAKPADAVDSCWSATDATRHREVATFGGAGICNSLYPKTPTPRMVAGGPVADDVIECSLKPIDDADYVPVVLSASDKARLNAVFPRGVCDYTKPGVGQGIVKGTWLRY